MTHNTLHKVPHATSYSRLWALIVAAVQILTLLAFWAALPYLQPDGVSVQTGSDTTHLPGKDFSAVVAAESREQGNSAVIVKMQAALRNGVQIGEAVFRTEPMLEAGQFSQMQIHLDGWQPGQKLFMFWRSSIAPDQQRYKELLHDPAGMSWHTLSSADLWEGEILELAIGVFGQPDPRPLRLHEVVLHPTRRSIILQRLRWDWSRFQPWTYVSANTRESLRSDILLPPATAASLWGGFGLFAVFFCCIVLRRRGRSSPRIVVIAMLCTILIPWLALDLRWQAQLERQQLATRERYSGLTQSEKQLREDDAALQVYAARLRDTLAPMRGKRLILLNDADKGHSYRRLRLQFHLLPLNVYNFGKQLLPPGQMRPGDHVLLLTPTSAVRYNPERALLRDNEHQYRATLLDDHPQGRLFRLEATDPQAGGPY